MDKFDLTYLDSLIAQTSAERENFQYYIPDETDAEITYLPSKSKLCWAGLIETLDFQLNMKRYRTQERSDLRSNCKNYFRIVRKSGKLLRIDNYSDGKLEYTYLAFYTGKLCYCFPFLENGSCYPSYTTAVRYENDTVREAWMVRSGHMLYYDYVPVDESRTALRYINYLSGCVEQPVNCKEIGVFCHKPELTYTSVEHWSMWERE